VFSGGRFWVIIQNTEDYVHKIENELQDSSTYKQVEKDLTEEITKTVEKTVNKLRKKNYITDDISFSIVFSGGRFWVIIQFQCCVFWW
jgi:hypothetical protein